MSNFSEFKFTSKPKPVIVETELMREMESRIMAVHSLTGLVVVYGSAGVGKTTLAAWMCLRINDAFSHQNENAFRAVLYESGEIATGNQAKKAVRAFFTAVTGTIMDEGLYWRSPTEDLADLVVHAIHRNRTELVFVDEAGLISVGGLGGLVLISDKARQLGYGLTVVLIGMDDLPGKLSKRRPQLFRRVHDWCNFTHHTIEDTYVLLCALHPHFEGLDCKNPEHWGQVKFVHEISNGLPGFIIQFIRHFDAQARNSYGMEIGSKFLRAVHMRTLIDYQSIVKQASANGISTKIKELS